MGGPDIREDTPGYHPPEAADEQPPWVLAFKMALACTLVALIARAAGYPNPTTGVISTAFLVSNGPVKTASTALWRMASLLIGGALGMVAAQFGRPLAQEPLWFFPLLGAIGGWLGSLRPDLIYVIVIGIVVAAQGAKGDQPIPEVAVEMAVQIAASCIVGPAVVWAVESVRARLSRGR